MANYTVSTLDDSGDNITIGTSLAVDQADGGGLSIREPLHYANNVSAVVDDIDILIQKNKLNEHQPVGGI